MISDGILLLICSTFSRLINTGTSVAVGTANQLHMPCICDLCLPSLVISIPLVSATLVSVQVESFSMYACCVAYTAHYQRNQFDMNVMIIIIIVSVITHACIHTLYTSVICVPLLKWLVYQVYSSSYYNY